MRMERIQLRGFSILNDAYNSNPASAVRAILEFVRGPAAGRRVVVLGDMRELGGRTRYWHEKLGDLLAGTKGVDLVVGVGPETSHVLDRVRGVHFGTVEEACRNVHKFLRPGDSLLLKGSREVGLENLIKAISVSFKNVEKVSA